MGNVCFYPGKFSFTRDIVKNKFRDKFFVKKFFFKIRNYFTKSISLLEDSTNIVT